MALALVAALVAVSGCQTLSFYSQAVRGQYQLFAHQQPMQKVIGDLQTPGRFKEPILNTFIFDREPDLAETIFHELGHQELFARGDTDFNEAFATTVGQEGARRWLRAKGDQAAAEKYEAQLRRTQQFVHLI